MNTITKKEVPTDLWRHEGRYAYINRKYAEEFPKVFGWMELIRLIPEMKNYTAASDQSITVAMMVLNGFAVDKDLYEEELKAVEQLYGMSDIDILNNAEIVVSCGLQEFYYVEIHAQEVEG